MKEREKEKRPPQQDGKNTRKKNTTASAKDNKKGESAAAAAKCGQHEETTAVAAGEAEASAAACTTKGKTSATGIQGKGEASAAAEMEKIDEITIVSQYDGNEQLDEKDEEIKAPIEERRKINTEDKERLKNVTRRSTHASETKKGQEGRNRYNAYWKKSKGSRAFRTLNLRGKERPFQKKKKNEKGETITSRKGIANVFGKFYCKLYAEEQQDDEEQESEEKEIRTGKENEEDGEAETENIPEFTEYKLPLTASKKRKSGREQWNQSRSH